VAIEDPWSLTPFGFCRHRWGTGTETETETGAGKILAMTSTLVVLACFAFYFAGYLF
jgi:hypothetical protein